ncbi:AAA family ATPase [uncultured Cetobacterium sp.]|uniref:AAA family ATPase n=1 Tax=uncultured Cetobacterium sp. TaxID=527638 RepID=UPI002618C07F|nr:AAA family ATPase [uncultured Cetobacterium sp.]
MINSIRMINFKNISDSTVDFKSNISGIYGPNGSGKTTIIEGISLLKSFFGMGDTHSDYSIKDDSLSDIIKKGEEKAELSMELQYEDIIFKIGVIFERKELNEVVVLKEYMEYKENKPRQKYKNLFTVENTSDGFLPKIFIEKSKKDQFGYFQKNLFKKNNTSFQSLIKKMNEFKSFFFILENEYSRLIEGNMEDNILNNIMINWKILSMALKSINIITLKDQAICNMTYAIPIYSENKCIYLDKRENLYFENIYEEIKKAVENINKLFPLFIPGVKVICEGEIKLESDIGTKYAVNIYIERNGNKIDIFKESTGTIKLFSILSAIIQILKNEYSSLIIDELDVHVFEYLLAFILSKLSSRIKGQLVFTSHNLLPMEKLDRNSIILSTTVSEEDSKGNTIEKVIYTYFKGKISHTTNLRLKYLRSQYTWTEDNVTPLIINESKIEKVLRDIGEK